MPVETVPIRPIRDVELVKELVAATKHVDRDDLVARLVSSDALLEGHFQLLSGLHSSVFLRFRNFVADGDNLAWATGRIATAIRQQGLRFDAIVCPDTAGSLLADEIAAAFGRDNQSVLPVETSASNEPLENFVGASPRPTDRVLIINDILTTGNGVRAMRQAIQSTGASCIGVGLFACRVENPETVLGSPTLPAVWLFSLKVEQVSISNCKQCKIGDVEPIEARTLN